jgi:hypothetical protein
MGLVALISPKYFARVASWSGRWIDSRKLFEVFDKRIEIDDRILPYSRILGALVLASVSVLGFCLAGR